MIHIFTKSSCQLSPVKPFSDNNNNNLYSRDLWSALERYASNGNRRCLENDVMAKQVPEGNSSEDEVSG